MYELGGRRDPVWPAPHILVARRPKRRRCSTGSRGRSRRLRRPNGDIDRQVGPEGSSLGFSRLTAFERDVHPRVRRRFVGRRDRRVPDTGRERVRPPRDPIAPFDEPKRSTCSALRVGTASGQGHDVEADPRDARGSSTSPASNRSMTDARRGSSSSASGRGASTTSRPRRWRDDRAHPAPLCAPAAIPRAHLEARCGHVRRDLRHVARHLRRRLRRASPTGRALPPSSRRGAVRTQCRAAAGARAHRVAALLRAMRRIVVELVPAMSFLDVAWARLGIDPVEGGVRLRRPRVRRRGAAAGPMLVAHATTPAGCCRTSSSPSRICTGAETPVVVLQRLGMRNEAVTTRRGRRWTARSSPTI